MKILARRCATALLLSAITAAMAAPAPFSPQRPDGHRTPVDTDIPAYDPVPPLSGELYVGGGLMTPLIDQWIDIFKRAHPSVRVHNASLGSTSAFGQLVEGITKVVLLTREFMPFETDFMQMKLGIAQPGFVVATGGYTSHLTACVPSQVVLVHPDNPIKGLTLTQLDAIFSKTRNRGAKEDITTWGQVGLTGEWADKPIHVYHPEMPDGVPNFFKINVMKDGEFKDTNKSLYKFPGATKNDRYAIALGNQGPGSSGSRGHLPEDRDPNAKVVPLATKDGGPYTTGTFEEIRTRRYPLTRDIYLYLRALPNVPVDPLAKEFVRVALSQEGQRAVARTCLMPLPANVVADSVAKLK